MDVLDLSSKLINFRSISPSSSGSLEFIDELLKKNKFECKFLEFGKTKKVKNLYAYIKCGEGPNLCFAGHTDVVPPGSDKEWSSPPFSATIRNGVLYGRGASDMKTAIASFIFSSIKFIQKKQFNFNGTISFLLTADEEGEADYGTKKVVEWIKKKNHKIDFCLVGEPTNPNKLGEMVKVGRRGSLNGKLIINGSQGHVAYPEKCNNPIEHLIKVCNKLVKPFDNGSKLFQPTKLVITSIDVGNDVTNLVPNNASLKFNVRFNDQFNSKDIIKVIKERISEEKVKHKLSVKVSGESFFNYSEKLTSALTKAIKSVTHKEPELSTTGGTSDARFISKICPVIEFGIVGKTMHKINENVRVVDLENLTKIYSNFLDNFFK